MFARRIYFQLLLAFALMLFIIIVALDRSATNAMQERIHLTQSRHLLAWAALLENEAAKAILSNEPSRADNFCKELRKGNDVRVTLILPDGRVVGDSLGDPAGMNNHADRPEFIEAVKSGSGTSTRPSPTLGRELMYVALRVDNNGQLLGVLRTAWPLDAADEDIAIFRKHIWGAAIMMLALLLAATYLLSRHFTRPLEELRELAERYAEEDFSRKPHAYSVWEFEQLAHVLTKMARQLDERLKGLVNERNERGAILSSMREGLLAIDQNDRILEINRATEQLLNVSVVQPIGMLVPEAVRNADLVRFLGELRREPQNVSQEHLIKVDENRHLQIKSSPLLDLQGNQAGRLLIIRDVTRLLRLESLRQEFVSNVSHELRTPITSIQGFIETLRDGAIHEPENATRFLDIIKRQADRLGAIIEDLLALSRIETAEGNESLQKTRCSLPALINTVIQGLTFRIEQKRLRVTVDCPEGFMVQANAHLLEQAISNLLDNAVKYSPEGEQIIIRVKRHNGEFSLRVIDRGAGIDPKHHSRLFERFYRVDRARSRELGGTGLGLSIVKHIAQTHNGSVHIESEPGEGSTFIIRMPIATDHDEEQGEVQE